MAIWGNVLQAIAVYDVDGKTVGNTEIFATPGNGEDFFVTLIQIITGPVNTVTVPPTISVGITASGYADIMGATALTGHTLNGYMLTKLPNTDAVSIGNLVSVKTRVSVAATATSFLFRVVLFGYYNKVAQ